MVNNLYVVISRQLIVCHDYSTNKYSLFLICLDTNKSIVQYDSVYDWICYLSIAYLSYIIG